MENKNKTINNQRPRLGVYVYYYLVYKACCRVVNTLVGRFGGGRGMVVVNI